MNLQIYRVFSDNINFFNLNDLEFNNKNIIHFKAYAELIIADIFSNRKIEKFIPHLSELINNLNKSVFISDKCLKHPLLCEESILSLKLTNSSVSGELKDKLENNLEPWLNNLLILQHYAVINYLCDDYNSAFELYKYINNSTLGIQTPLETSSYDDIYEATHAIIFGTVYGTKPLNKRLENRFYDFLNYFKRAFYFSFFDKQYDLATEVLISISLISSNDDFDLLSKIELLDKMYFNNIMIEKINSTNISKYYHQMLVRIILEWVTK